MSHAIKQTVNVSDWAGSGYPPALHHFRGGDWKRNQRPAETTAWPE